MNRSDLLLKKRNAPEKRQKRGCCGSTELPIVVARRSWREISCGKLGTLIQQTKNSLNFVSTCLKVVDTRRRRRGRRFLAWALAGLYCAVRLCGIAVQKQPQYPRDPQQRSLAQPWLPVRPRLFLRWRQPDSASEVNPDSECLTNVGNSHCEGWTLFLLWGDSVAGHFGRTVGVASDFAECLSQRLFFDRASHLLRAFSVRGGVPFIFSENSCPSRGGQRQGDSSQTNLGVLSPLQGEVVQECPAFLAPMVGARSV